jgi:hypothetical protein
MGDFLTDLVTKNSGRPAGVQPRLASRFEPVAPVNELEQRPDRSFGRTGIFAVPAAAEGSGPDIFDKKENSPVPETAPPFSPESALTGDPLPANDSPRFHRSEKAERDDTRDLSPPKIEELEAHIPANAAKTPRGLEEIIRIEAALPPELPSGPLPPETPNSFYETAVAERRPDPVSTPTPRGSFDEARVSNDPITDTTTEDRRTSLTQNSWEPARPKVPDAAARANQNLRFDAEFDVLTESDGRTVKNEKQGQRDKEAQSPVISPIAVKRRQHENKDVRSFPESPATRNGFEKIAVPEPPVINITIGRVEVRAVNSPAPAKESPNRPRATSLEEYLQKRHRGGER